MQLKCGHMCFTCRFLRLGGKRGHADSTADSGHANKTISYVSAFSTLVENADTLEDAQKMRKNVRIRQFLTCPHFPLKWEMRTRKKFSYSDVFVHFLSIF